MTIFNWIMAATLLLPFGVASAATSTSVNVPITILAVAGSDEEFVGPFASWLNVRTIHSVNPNCANATGNGTTDDAAAIQCAINTLSEAHPILYFPAGTYKVNSTLSIGGWVSGTSQQIYYCMIGADPTTTQIVWGGGASSMFVINGLAQGCVGRLTFDGQSIATVIIDDVSAGTGGAPCGGCAFDTGNKYFDIVAKNGGGFPSYGFRCGYHGNGCSETTIIRSTFSNVNVGVQLCNANAADVWIWYSTFSANTLAVSDYHIDSGPGAGLGAGCAGGNWHIAGSVFLSSTLADTFSGNPSVHSVIDSYSSGSNQFAIANQGMILARNTILNTTQSVSVALRTGATFIDNVIKTKAGNSAPSVTAPFDSGFNYFGVGNTYNISDAVDQTFVNGAYYSVGDTVATIPDSAAPTYPTPPNNGRTVYEAGALGLQTAICKASNGARSTFSAGACTGSPDGLKNIAHLAAGTYTVTSSIAVPANSNAQIIGDGGYSYINGSGGSANPVFLVNGPTHIVMRDLQFSATPSIDGIKIVGADQSGGFVYLENHFLVAGGGSSSLGVPPLMSALYSDSLNSTLIEAHDLSAPYTNGSTIVQTGANQLNIFYGSGGIDYKTYEISGSANFFVQDFWFDGPDPGGGSASPHITVTGKGSFYFTGGNFSIGDKPIDIATFNNFTGVAAFLQASFPEVCPNAYGKVNITGVSSSDGMELSEFSSYPSAASLNNTATGNTVRFLDNSGINQSTCVPFRYTDTGTADSTVTTILARYRTIKPMIPHSTGVGVTGAELYNLIGSVAANILHITQ